MPPKKQCKDICCKCKIKHVYFIHIKNNVLYCAYFVYKIHKYRPFKYNTKVIAHISLPDLLKVTRFLVAWGKLKDVLGNKKQWNKSNSDAILESKISLNT